MNYSHENLIRVWHSNRGKGLRHKRTTSRILLTVWIVIWILVLGVGIAGISAVRGAYQSLVDEAPDISQINVTPTSYATFVYDNQGNQTAKLVSSDSNRIPVTMDMIPKNLQHAFVAIEDERFYEHHGIDIQGILRAAVHGLTTGRFDEGASTITQQLIKNTVFPSFTQETFAESVRRKIQEQYLAVQLEQTMSKDDILLNYLNIINLGHNTLGVQAASLRYFGKSVSNLNLSECAVIAGITQNPTRYDPINHPENNARRRKLVLDAMLSQGWITQSEYDEALADDVYSRIQAYDTSTENEDSVNSYFVDALTEQVLADLEDAGYTQTQATTMLYSGGLHIYSTQDPDIQAICDDEANNADNYPNGTKWSLDYQLSILNDDGTMNNYSTQTMLTWMKNNNLGSSMLFTDQDTPTALAQQYKSDILESGGKITGEKLTLIAQPQISLTIEDQRTGNVLAIVGGRGDKTANRTLNRATDTMRQPGSTFKVVSTYAPALDAGGKTLATTYVDEPYTYENGTPVRNWYDGYRGTASLRTAIQDSMNIITVKTLTDITPRLGYEYLLRFGFTTLVDGEVIDGQTYTDVRQTLALGGITKGVKNIELNAAYAAIANAGTYITPKLYTKITDHDGNTILDTSSTAASNRVTRQVIRPATAWLLTSAMEDVVTKGTGTACQISETPVAGKTGTTSDEHDVWFAGYSNYYTCTTWAGYDSDSDSKANLTGSEPRIARTLWQKVMERVHANLSYSDFDMPSTVTHGTICSKSGLLPVEGLCNNYEVTEYFDTQTYPTESCNESYHEDDIAAARQAAQEAAQQAAIDASPEVAAAQEAVNSAQTALDEANTTLATATQILQQAQQAVTDAQTAGDEAAIAQAAANNETATTNYNTAVAQQAQAQATYDAASASLESARQAAIASVNTDTSSSTSADSGTDHSDSPDQQQETVQ